jgi:hypothetical protein
LRAGGFDETFRWRRLKRRHVRPADKERALFAPGPCLAPPRH